MLNVLLSALVAVAPLQWQIFALRHPEETKSGAASASLSTLKRVNDKVNKGIVSVKENGDTWSIWPHVGDCDDYAITKRHELLKLNIASRLAIVKLKNGQYHLVLVSGGYVLDNIRKDIVRKNAMNYKIIMEQSSNPNVWVMYD